MLRQHRQKSCKVLRRAGGVDRDVLQVWKELDDDVKVFVDVGDHADGGDVVDSADAVDAARAIVSQCRQ